MTNTLNLGQMEFTVQLRLLTLPSALRIFGWTLDLFSIQTASLRINRQRETTDGAQRENVRAFCKYLQCH